MFQWRTSFNRHLLSSSKSYAYRYIRNFMLLSQHHNPAKSHWVLKTPIHSLFMNDFLEQFDDATVIVTHRDPLVVIPSVCKLIYFFNAIHCRDVRQSSITRYFSNEEIGVDMCEMVRRMGFNLQNIDFQSPSDQSRVIHVEYDALLRDPIGIVRDIYQRAGLELSEAAEGQMQEYLEENKREREKAKRGSTFCPYSLEEFSLTEEFVRSETLSYRRWRGYE
jgi:hypothetical protein